MEKGMLMMLLVGLLGGDIDDDWDRKPIGLLFTEAKIWDIDNAGNPKEFPRAFFSENKTDHYMRYLEFDHRTFDRMDTVLKFSRDREKQEPTKAFQMVEKDFVQKLVNLDVPFPIARDKENNIKDTVRFNPDLNVLPTLRGGDGAQSIYISDSEDEGGMHLLRMFAGAPVKVKAEADSLTSKDPELLRIIKARAFEGLYTKIPLAGVVSSPGKRDVRVDGLYLLKANDDTKRKSYLWFHTEDIDRDNKLSPRIILMELVKFSLNEEKTEYEVQIPAACFNLPVLGRAIHTEDPLECVQATDPSRQDSCVEDAEAKMTVVKLRIPAADVSAEVANYQLRKVDTPVSVRGKIWRGRNDIAEPPPRDVNVFVQDTRCVSTSIRSAK
jgi:hypothetical protein